MEANNLFNFGGHPSESANSGLKHSSGDTLYSNGSSMSFPQPSKNMNGDVNVNGITTVTGTSASGSHPSTAYSLMSNHHQSSLGYDYLWEQAQYNPAVSTGHGTGLHPKQGSGGAMQQPQPQSQPQPQQHFQGHGQYQLNGGVGGASRQSAVAAPPNVTGAGSLYWSRGSPGPQQSTSSMNMSYGASNVYGSYQNQVHPSITPPQHQQQQQQHHHQQQPHFGMVSNGMPYYQHQTPPSPLAATQTQSQASVIPLTAQNLTPSCSSPQLQHHLGHGSSSSPRPSVAVLPSNVLENGALQSPDTSMCSQVVLPTAVQGHLNEVYKEVDTGYSEVDQASAVQRLPEAEVFTSKPSAPQSVPPSKYCPPAQHTPPDVGQPINRCHSMAVTGTDPATSVVSPLPVMVVETGSQMAHQSGLGNKIVSSMESTGDVELVVPHAKIKELEVSERDSLMTSQLEVKFEEPCKVTSTMVLASASQVADRTSELLRGGTEPLEREDSTVSEGALNTMCNTEESNYTALMESSCMDSSGAGGTGTLEETLNKVFSDVSQTDEDSVTDSSAMEKSMDVSSQHNTSQVEETLDTGFTTEDSVLLNDTSNLEDSLSASQNTTGVSSSHNVSMSAPSDDSRLAEVQDVPDSALGGSALTLGKDQKEVVVFRAKDSLPNDRVCSVSSRASGITTKCSAKLTDPKRSLSQSTAACENHSTTELKGITGGEMTGSMHQTAKMKNRAKFLAGQPVGSSSAPCPSHQQNLVLVKPKQVKKVKKLLVKPPKVEVVKEEDDDDEDDEGATASGDVQRRRIATEEQVNFPLLHGWRREVRVKKCENRLKGETWYYSPCGKRMKQFPEVIKYLNRHQGSVVTREHFSFSPRMPVGDFYEERETAEGMKWFLLADEEVPSIIMAITGRRGRPPNPDKERPRARRAQGGSSKRPGRPPKTKMVDLLSKVDAKLLKRLEAQETLSEEDKEKLNKIKKKMKRKAKNRKKEAAKMKKSRQEKRKAKLEKAKELQEQAGAGDQTTPQPTQESKKPLRRKREKVEEKVEEKEDPKKQKRSSGARSKAKALAKAQAEAEAQAQAVLAARRQAERRAQAQRRQEERRRQQLILEELKKPTEDMCLTDHQPLPEFSRVPGVVLSGQAFSHCLMVVEFLQSYGKVLGLQAPRDVPSLSTLQEGLLGLGDSQGEVQDLLVKLVQAALCDPGLPSYYQSVKILGEKLVDLDLNRSSVSEGLRIFLESHAYEAEVCKSLRTKPFQAHSPDTKASILAFLVDELNGSNIVIREIDNTLENMTAYRKNKWTIEGKLRKLKSALARRTGRSEDELGLEDRRRSARVAEEESLGLEECGLLERSSRRGRKEEVQFSEGESPTTASIPELERQIDKLTKRQVFFRKKLLQASHSLRAVSLGQDRYRRRYWVMPHIGGILVEGPEEILVSEDILVKEDVEPVSAVKTEPKSEPIPEPKLEPPLSPTTPLSPNPHLSPVEVDTLPGTASLMSSPRARGRPRRIKPEVELHLRAAKNRRRRRSIKAPTDELTEADAPQQGMQDLTQSAFLSWLSQTEGCFPGGVAGMEVQQGDSGPQESVKEMAEKQGQWFNLLPKNPCDSSSVSQPSIPTSPLKNVPQSPLVPPGLAASLLKSDQLFPDASLYPQVCSTPVLKPGRRRRRRSSAAQGSAGRFSFPAANKRRGRPPSKLLQEIEQKYFTQLIARPIPAAMVRGWWWIREPEELTALLQALHPRGIREKALHKHLSKHMEYLTEFCSRCISDPIFQLQCDEGSTLSQTVQQSWKEFEKTMETDISVLQWVEDLEQRVFAADLQIKIAPQSGPSDTDGNTETTAPGFQGFTVPEPDSTREDLQYYDHDVELIDDWIVKTKKEWSNLLRMPTNPLDLAVLRLLNLERNIERRYLKEPLWTPSEVVRLAPLTPIPGEENHLDIESLESEITPRLRAWRQAVDRCRSAAQLSLCLLQLERAIAWEKSVIKVTCLVCKKGDNDEYLLLCDGCDRGCHMYCLRPKVTQVPDGDWFCPVCTSKENGDSHRLRRFPKSRSRKRHVGCYGSGSSDEDDGYKKGSGMTMRRREGPTVSSYARFSGDSSGSSFSPSKRRRMTTRNQPDLTYCEIILMEMEAHADAWPFLEPVNPRLVPGYRRIIKRPMDFLTMRERLLQGGYCSSEEFAADAQLVFNNCQLFNEDTSEVGMAGHSMRRFFESRWAEFYHKDK